MVYPLLDMLRVRLLEGFRLVSSVPRNCVRTLVHSMPSSTCETMVRVTQFQTQYLACSVDRPGYILYGRKQRVHRPKPPL